MKWIALSVLMAISVGIGGVPAQAVERPNILLIVTDDQRSATLEFMPIVESQLVAKGADFTKAHVVNPLCCPSRASLLTGTYSHTNKVYRNKPPGGGFAEFTDSNTIATTLQAAGYRTSLVGKYLNGYGEDPVRSQNYIPPGWDDWHAITSQGSDYYNYTLNEDGELRQYGDQPEDYLTDVVFERAGQFIDRSLDRGDPFFAYVAPNAPHNNAVSELQYARLFDSLAFWRPPSFNEKDVSDKPRWMQNIRRLGPNKKDYIDDLRRRQLATLQSVDEDIGILLDHLRQRGQLDNTLIIYTSDNGYFWGEHRVWGKNLPYEEATQIPLIARFDGQIPVREDPGLITLMDLAPTFAAWAGTTMRGADGLNIRGYMTQKQALGRRVHLIESAGSPDEAPPWCQLRGPGWVFTHYSGGEEEYYNLELDPFQLHNRIRHAKVNVERRKLRQLCSPLPPGMVW